MRGFAALKKANVVSVKLTLGNVQLDKKLANCA